MPGEIQWLSSLGVGGVLAGAMFWFYRVDRRQSESRYKQLAADFKSIIQENTRAITALTEQLRRNGPAQP